MNLEKYSERVRGFIQSAQSFALGEGHQQFASEHLLKILLDDEQGMASSLIDQPNLLDDVFDVNLSISRGPHECIFA